MGDPSCACAHDPARRHGPHLYLKFNAEGKPHSVYVPRQQGPAIKKCPSGVVRFLEIGSFLPWSVDLSLPRVFIITSKYTCSASEALINGLAPYMEVVTVGSTTCGKPVGSSVEDSG